MSYTVTSTGTSSTGVRKGRGAALSLATAIFAVSAISGCGGAAPATSDKPAVTSTSVVTQVVTVTAEPVFEPPETSVVAKPVASNSEKEIVVPDGVGMNYQQAQDLWRGAGLAVAPAHDATGANRLPVMDRNWFVLSQDLKPGLRVTADALITATVKKYTDN